MKALHGFVRGNTIELNEDLGMREGQAVEVLVRVARAKDTWGEGLRRCAGALAHEWSPEDDRILEEIHGERKQDSRREFPE
jgi:hypothetical protein